MKSYEPGKVLDDIIAETTAPPAPMARADFSALIFVTITAAETAKIKMNLATKYSWVSAKLGKLEG